MIQFNNLKEKAAKIQVCKTVTAILLFTFLCSCASGSYIVTGRKRPAISKKEVKIYIDAPARYETVGIVEAAGEVGFSRQATQNKIMKKLKSRAAKIGANGVLLTNTDSKAGGMTGIYSSGIFYGSTGDKMVAQGRAIFVLQE